MNPYEDKLYVGTRAGVSAIINDTDGGICVATITAFPWDPACTVPGDYARMFAAAPEMLVALRKVVRACNASNTIFSPPERAALEKCEAAIAKATGSQKP